MTQTATQNSYNARDHLVTISTKQGPKPYLPAAWRLYELNLKFPDANFTSEAFFIDVERDLCAVKVRLFLGPDFDLASKKTESMKSGPFSALDKVETACKARCARDFGISTELALDIEEAQVPMATEEQIKRLVAYAGKLGYEESGEGLTFEDANQLLKEWYDEYQRKQADEKRDRAPLNGNKPVSRENGIPMR